MNANSLFDIPHLTLHNFFSGSPGYMEFSPSCTRLVFLGRRGALCIASLSGISGKDPFVHCVGPPAGHFFSAAGWESDVLLWVALSNGHVACMSVKDKINKIRISTWLPMRIPDGLMVRRVVSHPANKLVAVAYSDCVEVWQRRAVGTASMVGCLRHERDQVVNVWFVTSKTIAVHFRHRGLCYWRNCFDRQEKLADVCFAPGRSLVAYNPVEKAFAVAFGSSLKVVVVHTRDNGTARFTEANTCSLPPEFIDIRFFRFVNIGSESYILTGSDTRMSCFCVRPTQNDNAMPLQFTHDVHEFTSGETRTLMCATAGIFTHCAVAGATTIGGTIKVFALKDPADEHARCHEQQANLVNYHDLLIQAWGARRRWNIVWYLVCVALPIVVVGFGFAASLRESVNTVAVAAPVSTRRPSTKYDRLAKFYIS